MLSIAGTVAIGVVGVVFMDSLEGTSAMQFCGRARELVGEQVVAVLGHGVAGHSGSPMLISAYDRCNIVYRVRLGIQSWADPRCVCSTQTAHV